MPLDFEELDMIATCKRFPARLSVAENVVITDLDSRRDPITRRESADLRALWNKVTNDGSRDTRV